MKRALTLLLSLIMIIGLFTSCTPAAPGADTGGDTGEVVKVGWIGSLTGDQAIWGQCERNTIQMLVDEVNDNGGLLGKTLELVALDTQGKGEEAYTVTRRLIEQDGVITILGPNSSGEALGTIPALEAGGVPDIATVATNPKVTFDNGKVNPYNFRVCFIDPYQGSVAAAYAFNEMGKTKAAVLYDQSLDYSTGLTEFFIEQFEKLGGTIVAKEAFNSGDQEFKTQLTKIKSAEPDVLFLPYFFKEVGLTAKQARELGLDVDLIGGDGWPSEQLFDIAKDEMQGGLFVNHLDYADPAVQDYTKLYTDEFGKPPELNGFLAWDAFKVFEAAVNKANSLDPEDITKALEGIEVQGITGFIKIDPETHNPIGKEAAILRIEGEEYKFVTKYSVE
ncbi:MAG TPA: ABC transporter substrate-binding protein [Tissierellia bacterium]|nr:ABC transporter substrate-binding protein [Tissierellia bacterium]